MNVIVFLVAIVSATIFRGSHSTPHTFAVDTTAKPAVIEAANTDSALTVATVVAPADAPEGVDYAIVADPVSGTAMELSMQAYSDESSEPLYASR